MFAERGYLIAALCLLPCAVGLRQGSWFKELTLQSRADGNRKTGCFTSLMESHRRRSTSLYDSWEEYGEDSDVKFNGALMQSKFIPFEFGESEEVGALAEKPKNWILGRFCRDHEEFLSIAIAIATPVVAFATYEYVAGGYQAFVDLMSTRNWVAADGGKYGATIITPAVNGVVVPAIAVLFATLTSTTVSSLRQRQLMISDAINKEAGELRALEILTDCFPEGSVQDKARMYLVQYTTRVIRESSARLGMADDVINAKAVADNEMNGFYQLLNRHHDEIPSHILGQAYDSVVRLRQDRKTRVTALQSTYPKLHYMILVLSAGAESFGFLMETDQNVLMFLNAVQLKLLWSMLMGTFVACLVVIADLASPFAGSYRVDSGEQLHTIRDTLLASMELSQLKRQRKFSVPELSLHPNRETNLKKKVVQTRNFNPRDDKYS